MRKLTRIIFLLVLMSLAGASTARAGWVLEGSLGKGGRVNDPRGWDPTTVMLAPGYELLGMLRPQLGIVGALGDVKNSQFDLQLRPMLGLYPPILPIYARAIFAFEDLLHTKHVAVGGAVGLKIGLPLIGLGIFAEGAVLPRFVNSKTETSVEGRVGAFWVF